MTKLLRSKTTLVKSLCASALLLVAGFPALISTSSCAFQEAASEAKQSSAATELVLAYPPVLVATDASQDVLKPPAGANIKEGVQIAKTPPTVDFMYYPGQDHPGNPWSAWGDGCTFGDKYYSAIGDHLSPRGTALVFEYDSATKALRLLVDIRKFLESSGAIPEGMNYIPAKVHSRIDMGSDGWLYYSTHRGSPETTNDEYGYQGDWVFRTNPESGETEIVVAYPVPKHTLPASVLDQERLIFYGSTMHGSDAPAKGVHFFAYDVKNKRLLLSAPDGFSRYAILSQSTGRVFWDGKMYDPATNKITPSTAPDVRSATRETKEAVVYGTTGQSAAIWAFNVKTGELAQLGDGAVADSTYITTMDIDPSGRYLYYIPGAHGPASRDGTPVVQFDVKTRTRKVIAFLAPFYTKKYGYTPDGTFGAALSPEGDKLYITWNGKRDPETRKWDTCAMTVIHIPASERPSDAEHPQDAKRRP